MQTLKLKIPIWEKFRSKIEILSTLLKICCACRKIATSCPVYFLKPPTTRLAVIKPSGDWTCNRRPSHH